MGVKHGFAGETQGKNTGYADEGVKMDRGGVKSTDRVRNVDIAAGSHQAPGPRIIIRLSKLYYIQLKTVAHPFH